MSSGLLVVTETLLDVMDNVVMLIKKVFRVTATPEEDQKLRDAIKKAADQSQKIIEEFHKMRCWVLLQFPKGELLLLAALMSLL